MNFWPTQFHVSSGKKTWLINDSKFMSQVSENSLFVNTSVFLNIFLKIFSLYNSFERKPCVACPIISSIPHTQIIIQFSRSVVSDSLRPHESQHVRPPCPSPSPGVHSDSRPSSPWCHPAISSSVIPLSSCPQSFPASASFQTSQLFASGGQSIEVSASASVLPMNIQYRFPVGLTDFL